MPEHSNCTRAILVFVLYLSVGGFEKVVGIVRFGISVRVELKIIVWEYNFKV